MGQIDLSYFDDEIEDIDIFDFEVFEMRLDNMLKDAKNGELGISRIEADNLRAALVEDFDDPREAWQNLLFWEINIDSTRAHL